MQSLGSTSSWLSRDSLSSSHSLLLSESDQTEDDADVFLSEGEGEGDGTEAVQLGRPSVVSLRSHLVHGVFRNQAASQHRSGQTGRHSPILVPSSEGVKAEAEGGSEGDCVFAQKCAELQGFVRPLLELLNGLKKGRYSRGLSSFQQSVAMDRIQRIIGILQKPNMGERYLHTLLKVEMMLKLWFPRISPCVPPSTAAPPPPPVSSTQTTPPRWHRDQLHIPVKKRRLSWTESDCVSQPPECKRFQQEPLTGLEEGAASPRLENSDQTELDSESARSDERVAGWKKEKEEAQGMVLGYKIMHWPEQRLTWVYGAPVLCCQKSRSSNMTRRGKKGNNPPPLTLGCPATQDTFISSTTLLSDPLKSAPMRRRTGRCQSEPTGGEGEDCRLGASEMCQGWSLSLPHLLKSCNASEL